MSVTQNKSPSHGGPNRRLRRSKARLDFDMKILIECKSIGRISETRKKMFKANKYFNVICFHWNIVKESSFTSKEDVSSAKLFSKRNL